MSVLIKGMDVPGSCYACPFYDDMTHYCEVKNRNLYKADMPKPEWCPVIPYEENNDN